jgi:hypothetical protein
MKTILNGLYYSVLLLELSISVILTTVGLSSTPAICPELVSCIFCGAETVTGISCSF